MGLQERCVRMELCAVRERLQLGLRGGLLEEVATLRQPSQLEGRTLRNETACLTVLRFLFVSAELGLCMGG